MEEIIPDIEDEKVLGNPYKDYRLPTKARSKSGAGFKFSDIDLNDPKSVKAGKEHILQKAYQTAIGGGKEAAGETQALKLLMDILMSAETTYNVAREEKLKELEARCEALEETLDGKLHVIEKGPEDA